MSPVVVVVLSRWLCGHKTRHCVASSNKKWIHRQLLSDAKTRVHLLIWTLLWTVVLIIIS